jgi:hypothetical protein
MWLALSSIVLAFSIGFNVLALWLTDTFGRDQKDLFERDQAPELGSTKENGMSPPRPAGGHHLPRGAKLLGAM